MYDNIGLFFNKVSKPQQFMHLPNNKRFWPPNCKLFSKITHHCYNSSIELGVFSCKTKTTHAKLPKKRLCCLKYQKLSKNLSKYIPFSNCALKMFSLTI